MAIHSGPHNCPHTIPTPTQFLHFRNSLSKRPIKGSKVSPHSQMVSSHSQMGAISKNWGHIRWGVKHYKWDPTFLGLIIGVASIYVFPEIKIISWQFVDFTFCFFNFAKFDSNVFLRISRNSKFWWQFVVPFLRMQVVICSTCKDVIFVEVPAVIKIKIKNFIGTNGT